MALIFVIGMSLLGLALLGFGPRFPRPTPFVSLQVRVNSATAQELTGLPGVGPVLAERIAKDRRHSGRYLTMADLKRVKGISPKILAKLNGLIRFD